MLLSSTFMKKPSPIELKKAYGKTLPDVIGPRLKILFVGINPGLYTAAIGHHFGRPGNRFWPALHSSGLTEKQLSPYEERDLLKLRMGITNVVPWATTSAEELTKKDFIKGSRNLISKIKRYRPKVVAFLGMGAYRTAFSKPKAKLGQQLEKIGPSQIWVLPNPSGLNANYQPKDFKRLFSRIKRAVQID